MDFPIRFDHGALEEKIYRLWEEEGYFRAEPASEKEPFVIVIPPPNITSSLHMGHALNNTLQDLLVRWRRMQGYEALYLPGTDHAGIATQYVVEKELSKEGKSRFDLGREKFLERVWQWKEKYGNAILQQLRRLGCSCDWTRTRFTMDEGYSRAIRFVFVSLYKKGLIYRGYYIINWCPRCLTALSDIEVLRSEEDGKLWYLKYPLKDSSGFISVATTRPETILGDVAVAVNPKDPRYRNLVGKKAILPIIGRELPIIGDEFVDPSFGSGAVKITPAHDLADFEVAQRHDLDPVFVMDEKGVMNENAGEFKGLDRFQARIKILERFKKLGLYQREEDYKVPLSRCYRCNTIIEPYLSEQWFVRTKPLARPAIDAVEGGDVRFIPQRWAKVYLEWLYGAKDWCISRQIWWGHRIPAWYCNCGRVVVEIDPPSRCPDCRGNLRQDEDVLDTWFSSALWPFATLGWPEETEDLSRFYPTSVLVTARDIIYLWVARMIMTGLEFCGEKPFAEVFINPTVQNPQGRRMSKSLGTGIDPIHLVEQYGADAVRFSLASQVSHLQDIRFSEQKIRDARNFMTKIWNAARFVYTNARVEPILPEKKELALEDRWILGRLSCVIEDYTKALEEYRFAEAADIIQNFVWAQFCDWYIELAKRRISQEQVKKILSFVMEKILRLLHPYMPFVTEEIWHRMGYQGRLIVAEWPEPPKGFFSDEAEKDMELAIQIVRGIREIRSRVNLKKNFSLEATLSFHSERTLSSLTRTSEIIKFIGGLAKLQAGLKIPKPKRVLSLVGKDFSLYLAFGEALDLKSELARHQDKLLKLQEQRRRLESLLANQNFLSSAPPEVIEEQQTRVKSLQSQLETLSEIIQELKKLSQES